MAALFAPTIPKQEKKETPHPWAKTINHAHSRSYKYGHNSAGNPTYPKKNKPTDKSEERIKVTVIGNRIKKEFIYCYYLVKGLYKYRKKQFAQPLLQGVTSVEWPEVWRSLKIQYGGKAHCLTSQVAVIINDSFLGGEDELKKYIESKYVYPLCLDYYKEGVKQLLDFIISFGRPCAYMHISINGEDLGPLIFMLYSDIVPRTCDNFLRLCDSKKGGYTGTPIHRIVKDCWIQCGGFGLKNSPELDCENFVVPHDRRGVLCMTNDGRHVECSTQFFVLLQPAPWMEHKYVAFGQLIEGESTLRKIENVPTWYESPTKEIIIYKAGIFNMECQYMPINKNTNAYIDGHIENLYELGELFYEEIIQRVFDELTRKEIELQKQIESLVEIAGEIDKAVADSGQTQKKASEVTSDDGSYVNNDFDVTVYQYEAADYTYSQIAAEPSFVVKPRKPYYIPLTDVPYPGEIHSAFDLKKVLNGYYCYENDLEPNAAKRKYSHDTGRRMSIPEDLVGALFECFTFGDHNPYDDADCSDSSLSSEANAIIENYTSENADKVSFAGPVVQKIANIPKKYEVFDEAKKEAALNRRLTDDELRIIRMAIKEYKSTREKKVSISLSGVKLSNMKIIRRPTGFIRKEDLAKLGLDTETYECIEGEDEVEALPEKVQRRLEPGLSKMHHHMQPDSARASVLVRLLDDVDKSDEGEGGPTLKDYKPDVNLSEKSFALLTFSKTFRLEDDSEKALRQKTSDFNESIDEILRLQHGTRLYRKLSSDYVRTIDHIEHKTQQSIRSIEYSKKRPTMSVSEYKMKNKQYSETLKTTSRTETNIKGDGV